MVSSTSFSVVIVLRFLGLIVVCCGVGEQPTSLSTEMGTMYCGVLTKTHPCDDPLRAPALACVFACAVVVVVTDCGN